MAMLGVGAHSSFQVSGRARQRRAGPWARTLLIASLFELAVAGCDIGGPEPQATQPAATPQAATPAAATPTVSTAVPMNAPPPSKRAIVDIKVPKLRARVNDEAQLLSKPAAARLEVKLKAHEQATGQQFALLTIEDLNGVNAADFGFTVANRWKLGRKEQNDGLLVLIGVKDRQVDIEVGRGLEAAIPNALAAQIIREQLAPALSAQGYADGLNAAFDRLIAASKSQ